MYDILCFHKIKTVMQRSCCKLHSHLIGNLIQRYKIRCIFILHCHTKANVLHTHLTQLFQRTVTTLISILKTTNLVIGLLQTLNGNADTNLRKLPAQIHNSVSKETICGNNDTVTLLVKFTHNILQISTNERLAAGNVRKIHFR